MPDYIPPPKELPPGSIVWAYLRDSGGDSQEQSVPQQQAVIEAYCKTYGLALERIFSDVAKSGGKANNRYAFLDMVKLSESPEYRPAGLLVWNMARFARNVDEAMYYKAKLRLAGMVIHSLTDMIPDGAAGRLVEALQDYSNQEKREQTSRDVRRGLLLLVQQGYSCGGFPPKGYLAEEVTLGYKRNGLPRKVSRWVADPELWELVKLAWKLRAEGASYGDIQEATGGRVFRSKSCWVTFFTNKTYLGIGKCGDEEIPDHHPAAVDLATWEKVQAMQAERPHHYELGQMNHARRVAYPSLLSGLAVCKVCGFAISHHHDPNRVYKWPYYICGRKQNQGYKSCSSRIIGSTKADLAVMDAVINRVLTLDYMAALLEETRAQLANTTALQVERDRLRAGLGAVESAIKNLVTAIEKMGLDDDLLAQLRQRKTERARLAGELRQLDEKEAAAQVEISPEALGLALEVQRQKIKQAEDLNLVKKLLKHFVAKIELGYNEAVIWYTFPFDDLIPADEIAPLWGHLSGSISNCVTSQWKTFSKCCALTSAAGSQNFPANCCESVRDEFV